MRRIRIRIPLVLLAALVVVLAAAFGQARAAPRPDAYPLHHGSHGPRVKALQWLLAGHKPGVFTKVAPTFKAKPNGLEGDRTDSALYAYKYRLGWPASANSKTHPVAGQTFFAIVEGKQKRPPAWVANAAARVQAVVPGVTKLAAATKSYEQTQLGVSEQPPGSNQGPTVRLYQSSTGAYGLAWCVSFQQWSLGHVGYGHFAGDTASVYTAVDYAAARNWLQAKPKVGALVAFIDYDSHGRRIAGTGHMGYVVKVEASSFTYIAGNDANRVNEHTIPDGSRSYAFIYLPGLTE